MLALSLVAVAAWACISRPSWMLSVLIVFVAFNGLGSQLLATAGASSTVLLVFGAGKDTALVLLALSALIRIRRSRSVAASLVLPVAGMMLVAAISGVLTDNATAAAYGFRNDFLPLVWLIIVPSLIDNASARRVQLVTIALGQFIALVAIYTHSLGMSWLPTIGIDLSSTTFWTNPSSTNLFTAGDPEPRAFSPFSGANALGLASVIAVALALAHYDLRLRWRILLSVLPLVALWLARSRSAGFGLVLVGVVIGMRWISERGSNKTRPLVGVALLSSLAVVGFVLLNPSSLSDPSAVGHRDSLLDTVSRIVSHPLGYGVGTVGPRAQAYYAVPQLTESFFGVLALEAGVIVLVLYLITLTTVALLLARHARLPTASGAVATGSLAVLAGSLVSQAVLPVLQETALAYLFWITVATGLARLTEAGENSRGARGQVPTAFQPYHAAVTAPS